MRDYQIEQECTSQKLLVINDAPGEAQVLIVCHHYAFSTESAAGRVTGPGETSTVPTGNEQYR